MDYTEQKAKDTIAGAGGDWRVFSEWMNGQTRPFVDGKPGYYSYDVERFIRYKCDPNNEPLSEWD